MQNKILEIVGREIVAIDMFKLWEAKFFNKKCHLSRASGYKFKSRSLNQRYFLRFLHKLNIFYTSLFILN